MRGGMLPALSRIARTSSRDRLLAFGDRVEIAHDCSDREVEAEGLDCP
jgi:hypothetical protein